MLKVLNINKFIKEHKVLEVTSRQSFNRDGEITPEGLYSEIIFGVTSKELSTTFGYINLKTNIVHPAILASLSKISTLFSKIVLNTKKAILENGQLVESDEGSSGVGWLFDIWKKIDFEKYKTEKNSYIINFILSEGREGIFINKFLVIPPKFRMYTIKHGMTIEDETTMFYKTILDLIESGHSENPFMQEILRNSSRDVEIQKAVNKTYAFFLQKLEKKEGAFRANLISKRIDNNVRLVANARPDIPFNCAGIPWHVLLNIFDAFVVGSLNKSIFSEDYSKKLGTKDFTSSKYGTHFDYIYRNVDTYTESNPGKREIWVKLLKELFDYHPELKVLLKRDPAWDKGSYHALFPVIIPTNSFHIVVNSLLYVPLGGDSFNTNFILNKTGPTIVETPEGTIQTKTDSSYYLKSLDSIYDDIEIIND